MKLTISLLLLLVKYQCGDAAGSSWDYDHMSTWSDDFPMCGRPKQSPIGIEASTATFDSNVCDATFDWDIDTSVNTFKIWNNGHSVVLKAVEEQVNGPIVDASGTEYAALDTNGNTIATLTNYFKPTGSSTSSFCLDSFHFHWGTTDTTGSEHFLETVQHPLELHFVHYDCSEATLGTTLGQYPYLENVTSAIAAGLDVFQLGVVGILFDVESGYTNAAFDEIFDSAILSNISYPASSGDDDVIVPNLSLTDLLPSGWDTSGYYAYEGSLTTPPCTDIVRWHVMNARGKIGTAQLAKFRELMIDSTHGLAPNYRDLQSNPSTVYGCVSDSSEEFNVVLDETVTKSSQLTWWAVAVISSVVTAMVMSAIFACVYRRKKHATHAATAKEITLADVPEVQTAPQETGDALEL